MTSLRLRILFAGLMVAVLSAPVQAGDATQFVAAQKKKSTTKKPRKYRGRLPQNYGKIGISTKQREQIYAIQLSYRERILALQKQLNDLRTKQGTEIEAVLTADQKAKLMEIREAAKKKRAAKKSSKPKKAGKGKTTDKKAA